MRADEDYSDDPRPQGRQLEQLAHGVNARRSMCWTGLEPEANCSLATRQYAAQAGGAGRGRQYSCWTTQSVAIELDGNCEDPGAVSAPIWFVTAFAFSCSKPPANILTHRRLNPYGKIPEFQILLRKVEAATSPQPAELTLQDHPNLLREPQYRGETFGADAARVGTLILGFSGVDTRALQHGCDQRSRPFVTPRAGLPKHWTTLGLSAAPHSPQYVFARKGFIAISATLGSNRPSFGAVGPVGATFDHRWI